MAGRDKKSLPGKPMPRLSYKASVWAAWEEQREREKQQPEAVHIDLEELKAALLGKEVNLWEICMQEWARLCANGAWAAHATRQKGEIK